MDVLYTVYLFNISELLPEILISISSCFTKAIRNNKEQFAKEIKDSQVIVDMIILKSFIFYSDEIKKDEKLINAYEDILLALTEIRNEHAQARARRPVLRAHLWTHQGLGMPLRQVQEDTLQGQDLRPLRRRGNPRQGAP